MKPDIEQLQGNALPADCKQTFAAQASNCRSTWLCSLCLASRDDATLPCPLLHTRPAGTTVLVCPQLMHRDPAWWGPDAAAFKPERWLEMQRAQQAQQARQGSSGSSASAAGCPHAAAAQHAAAGSGGAGAPTSTTTSGRGMGAGMAFLTNGGPNGAYLPFGAGQRNCIGTGGLQGITCLPPKQRGMPNRLRFTLLCMPPATLQARSPGRPPHCSAPLPLPAAGFAMMEAVLVLAAVLRSWRLEPLPGATFPAAQPQITLRPAEVRLVLRRR